MRVATARVGDLARQVRGVTYSADQVHTQRAQGLLPILRANNITETGPSFQDLVYVPANVIGSQQLLRANDVLIATSSGSISVVGKAVRIAEDFDGAFGAFCKVLRPSAEVDPAYFAHFFKTQDYRRRVSALAAGANINNLRNEHLDGFEIPLPPLPEQRRIADILDRAETLRAQRRQALAQLDALVQAIFFDMFGDPTTNPLTWPRTALGQLITEGPQNGLYKPATDYGSGTPILRIDGFYEGAVTDIGGLKRVRVSDAERETFGLQANNIVINRVNSSEYLGKCALVPTLPEPTVFESNMMRVAVDPGRVEPAYVVQFLRSDFIKAQIRTASKDAVNQSSINQQDVKAFVLNLPTLDVQREFVRRRAAVGALRAPHEEANAEANALFASLQHRAFRGEL